MIPALLLAAVLTINPVEEWELVCIEADADLRSFDPLDPDRFETFLKALDVYRACHPDPIEAEPEPARESEEPETKSVTTFAVAAPQSVEGWRPLVAAYFPAETVDTMLCLMAAESGGDPNALNPDSGAAGLFQIMGFWWDYYGGNPFDPETNVRVARAIWDQQGYGAWSPWNRGECH